MSETRVVAEGRGFRVGPMARGRAWLCNWGAGEVWR